MIKPIPNIIPQGSVFVYKDARSLSSVGSLFVADIIRNSDKRQSFIGGRGNYDGETYHFDRKDIETNLVPLGEKWERKLTQLTSIFGQLHPAYMEPSRDDIYRILVELEI
jgi:hypothetical protein